VDPAGERIAALSFVTFAVLCGGNGVGIRFSNQELAPLAGGGLRFALAAAGLAAVMAVMGLRPPRGRALVGALVYGVLNFGVSIGLLYYGLVRVHAGLGQTLIALVPLLTLLLAVTQRQERLRARAVAGVVLALAGVMALSRAPLQDGVPVLSLLAVIGSALCVAQATVLVRRFPAVHPVTLTAMAMATGAAILIAAATITGERFALPRHTSTWLAVAYMVAFGSIVAHVLYVVVLAHWTASRTAYAFVLIPVFTVVLSAWLDGEPLRAELVAGGFLVLLGVYVGALRGPAVSLTQPPWPPTPRDP
jgi:drug/metabolite transporter (DMT)-like permease